MNKFHIFRVRFYKIIIIKKKRLKWKMNFNTKKI